MDDRHPREEAAQRALQAALADAAREAGATQALLRDATSRFAAVTERVIDVVGGSAQQVDQQMVQSLQDAIRRTNSALAALAAVGSSTRMVR